MQLHIATLTVTEILKEFFPQISPAHAEVEIRAGGDSVYRENQNPIHFIFKVVERPADECRPVQPGGGERSEEQSVSGSGGVCSQPTDEELPEIHAGVERGGTTPVPPRGPEQPRRVRNKTRNS